MQKIVDWIKSNKLTTVLILAIAFLLLGNTPKRGLLNQLSASPTRSKSSWNGGLSNMALETADYAAPTSMESRSMPGIPTPPADAAPQPEVKDRMKVMNASISLHVEDVRKTIDAIETYVTNIGGYTINQHINTPQESSGGSINVRVPTEKLDETLAYFRERAVNVVYESKNGRDITDEYMDAEARLETLQKTKAIFENMLDEATEFDDILRAQKEILNVQNQIDRIKGQLEYMKGTAETARISVNLSTDELELGYAPANAWRPKVVFRKAVRQLVINLRSLGNGVIWLAVYSVIWAPVVAIVIFIKKRKSKKSTTKKSKK
ncbi:DUF4349 domain-containing protein [candidate division WWE3 bacterium]|nr:DUF4349 domain-containing protein [candidate division WWE3 bacterium]